MIDKYDVLAVIGLAILAYGLSRISVPLALSVVGGVLLTIGFFGAWVKGARR